jgi:D-serine deaminase-like pyridoxal phosphate-dependent protein
MITKPTLILDEKRCRKNIKDMFLKAQRNNVDFRPHFKTHQSLEIGKWFKELGVNKITVSSLEMAKYFAKDWEDITVAFPVNILEIKTINTLAKQIHLNLLIESVETADFLISNLDHSIGFFIKIDVGYHRTGLLPNNTEIIDKILAISEVNDLLDFKGFLTHAGQTYNCRTRDEILAIHKKCINLLIPLKKRYKSKYPNLKISVGDTPSCSIAEDFSMFDEIRPGNFVFYDLSQYQIGSCHLEQIAVALACPIVAIHNDRNEIVIYGGGVHFSKDRLEDDIYGTIYGKVVENNGNNWGDLIPKMFVKSISQEHGIVSLPEPEISKYKIGDTLFILPVHSCMTADALKSYQTTTSKIIERL